MSQKAVIDSSLKAPSKKTQKKRTKRRKKTIVALTEALCFSLSLYLSLSSL
jgi:hypothetical protein